LKLKNELLKEIIKAFEPMTGAQIKKEKIEIKLKCGGRIIIEFKEAETKKLRLVREG
jgi:hypothetical protein